MMGLVSKNYLYGKLDYIHEISHNRDEESSGHYVMNQETDVNARLKNTPLSFKPLNAEYLEWILPKPQP